MMKKLCIITVLIISLNSMLSAADYTWTGTESQDWEDPDNWEIAGVTATTWPGQTAVDDNVFIEDDSSEEVTNIGSAIPYTLSSITVGSDNTLNLSDGVTVGKIVNNGIINVTNGTLNVDTDITNDGSFTLSGGAINGDADITNNGTFVISGGTINVTGNIENNSDLDIGSQNLTAASITNTNNGTIHLSGATGQTITITPSTISGNGAVTYDTAGTTLAGINDFGSNDLEITAGNRTVTGALGAITVRGDFICGTGAGTLNLDSLTLSSANLIQNNGAGAITLTDLTANGSCDIQVGGTAGINVTNLVTINGAASLSGDYRLKTQSFTITSNGSLDAALGSMIQLTGGVWNNNSAGNFSISGDIFFDNGTTVNNATIFSNVECTGTVTFTGSNTFSSLECTGATIKFGDGTTQKIITLVAAGANLNSASGTAEWNLETLISGNFTTNTSTVINWCDSKEYLTRTAADTNFAGSANNKRVFDGGSFTWTGDYSGEWEDDRNWDDAPGYYPHPEDDTTVITIPAVTSPAVYPLLTVDIDCDELTVASGAEIDLAARFLRIHTAALVNQGTIKLRGVTNQVTINNAATPAPPPAPAAQSTIHYYNSGSAVWVFGQTYHNLVIDSNATMEEIAAGDLLVNGEATLNSSVTTAAGSQTYIDQVHLSGNSTVKGTAVAFNGLIDGSDFNLEIEITGNGAAALATISGGGSGIGELNIAGNTVFANSPLSAESVYVDGESNIGAGIETLGNAGQVYDGEATLTNNVTLKGIQGSPVRFTDKLNGQFTLEITSANAVFSGEVGGDTPLERINVTSGTSTISAGIATAAATLDGQNYGGGVILTNDVNFTGAAGSTVRFASTVTGNTLNGSGIARAMEISDADVWFGGNVGAGNSISSVKTSGSPQAGKTTIDTLTITTSQGQEYGGEVELRENIIIAGGTGSDILFGGTVDGPFTLRIQNADVRFDNTAGGVNPLAGLVITGQNNSISVNADIYTSGDQSYGSQRNGSTEFAGAYTLESSAGSISVSGKTSGVSGLTVNARDGITIDNGNNDISGTVTLNNTQGGTQANDVNFVTTSSAAVAGANPGGDFRASAKDGINVTTGGITANTASGIVTLLSDNSISIDNTINAFRLITAGVSGTAATAGTVAINDNITVHSGAAEGAASAVYVSAKQLTGNGDVILLNTNGAVCAFIDNIAEYNGNVTDGKIHYHSRGDRHIVYTPDPSSAIDPLSHSFGDAGGTTDPVAANDYLLIRADRGLGTGALDARTGGTGNIYIIDIGDGTAVQNTREVSFTTQADSYIEIRGTYTSSGNLNLDTGSVRLTNGENDNTSPAKLRLPSFDLSLSSIPLYLHGGTGTDANDYASISVIASGGITLYSIDGWDTDAPGINNLLLDASANAANTISVGEIGQTAAPGNIEVRSINPAASGLPLTPSSWAVIFSGPVTANSYKQTGANGTGGSGSAYFGGAQQYTAGFDFSGNSLALNNAMNTAGTAVVLIDPAGIFVKGNTGGIIAAGGFEQRGAGTSHVSSNIITTNTPIIFEGNLDAAPANGGTITFRSNGTAANDSTSGGQMEFESPISSSGVNRGLILASGTGGVILHGTVSLTGSFSKTGTGQTDTRDNITAGTNTTADYEIDFAGPLVIGNTANTGITLDTSAANGGAAGSINAAGFISGGGKNLTLNASGDININGKAGVLAAADTGGTSRLGVLEITNANNSNFDGMIWAGSFNQAAGAGLTSFNAAGDYTAGFAYNGAELSVNGLLRTDTDLAASDGAITVTGTLTTGTAGDIQGGGSGGTLTVNGTTTNNGLITAGPVAANTDAVTFNGDYAAGASGARAIAGSGNANYIVFTGSSITLGAFTHNNSITAFDTALDSSTVHNISRHSDFDSAPDILDNSLGSVTVRENNTLVLSGRMIQNASIDSISGTSLRPLVLKDNSVLDVTAGSWYLGATDNSPDDPGYSITASYSTRAFNGFYAFMGEAQFGSGSKLLANDFHSHAVNETWVTLNGPSIIDISDRIFLGATFGKRVSGTSEEKLFNSTIILNSAIIKVLEDPVTVQTNRGADTYKENSSCASLVDIGDIVFRETGNSIVSDLVIKGTLTIETGANLGTAGGSSGYFYPYIRIEGWQPNNYPSYSGVPPLITWMNNNGTPVTDINAPLFSGFDPGFTIVEFGNENGSSGKYGIYGNTDWHVLRSFEDSAALNFSNYRDPASALPAYNVPSHTHRVRECLNIWPKNGAPNQVNLITLDVMEDLVRPGGPYPSDPAVNPAPPGTPTEFFWHFYLLPEAEIYINYVEVLRSYSQTKIPVPQGETPQGDNWEVFAWTYIYASNGIFNPDNIPAPPSYFERTRWVVNWFVVNNFMYSFAEDSNHNGQIDRIRLQASFNVIDGENAFSGFEIGEIYDQYGNNYSVNTDKGYNGYRRVQSDPSLGPFDLDSIYVYIKEDDAGHPYTNGGVSLHWKVLRNTSLVDFYSGATIVGNGPEEGDPDEGWTTDTVPPRVNYSLALPGHGELFIQMSEPVTGIDLTFDPPWTGTLSPLNAFGSEYLIENLNNGSAPPSVADLYSGTNGALFLLDNVRDVYQNGPQDPLHYYDGRVGQNGATINAAQSGRAVDLSDPLFTNMTYYFLFPMPKYPAGYNYDNGGTLGYDDDGSLINSSDFQPYVSASGADAFTPGTTTPAAAVYPPNSPGTTDKILRHRFTDLLISVPPHSSRPNDYFAWPLWARYSDSLSSAVPHDAGQYYNDPEFPDIITEFDGRRFLEDRNIEIQTRINNELNSRGAAIEKLYFAKSFSFVPAWEIDSNGFGHGMEGFWLPFPGTAADDPYFVNMVQGWTAAENPVNTPSPPLFNFNFLESNYASGDNIGFFLKFDNMAGPGTDRDLFAGRLAISPGAAIPPDWYRRAAPFGFGIHDITRQRSGVTILNNVIYPDRQERVFLDYRLIRSGRVTIQVFTLDGNLVKVLKQENQNVSNEYYRVSWDGTNQGGRPVARGMYFIRVVAPDIDEIRKVMVVR